MAKGKNERTGKIEIREASGIKSEKSKQSRSSISSKYVQGSVRSETKVQSYNGKNSGILNAKRGEIVSVEGHGKNTRIGSSVLASITTKPESQMTSIEKMVATREGISKKALEELKENAGFDYDQLSKVLGVARTTLLNKKGAEKFPLGLSEKIMSLADLYSFGYEIFGDQEEFNQWIFQPLPALGGQAPYALLDNQFGREEVKNLIGRIAYGAYS